MKYIYCDGGCRPTNPGPGGYGVVMFNDDNEIEKYTKFISNETTNNRMELKGLLCAIKWASATNEDVIIYTDSAYARNAILNWVHTWNRNGWITSKRQPVLNRELIEEIYAIHLKEMNNEDNDEMIKYNKNILNIIDKDENLKKIFENCRQKLISNTINYAKYQIKFIKNRIMPYINGYIIVEIEKYDKETYINEYIPQIIDYLNDDNYITIVNNNKNKMEDWKRYYCDICKCEINGENDYNSHMKSNKHKKKKEKLRKKEKMNKDKDDNKDKINEIKNKISKIELSDSQG